MKVIEEEAIVILKLITSILKTSKGQINNK